MELTGHIRGGEILDGPKRPYSVLIPGELEKPLPGARSSALRGAAYEPEDRSIGVVSEKWLRGMTITGPGRTSVRG
jgi:hypothetical protein